MDAEIQFLDPFVTPERWPFFRTVLRACLAFALARLALRMWSARPLEKSSVPSTPAAPLSLLRWLFAVSFAAVLVHQSTWSLTGHLRPRFVEFMQRYDRRQFNPAHAIRRGAILDRRGAPIATSPKDGGTRRREYPLGPAGAHVVGYADLRFGLSGLEEALNSRLTRSVIEDKEDLASLGNQIFRGDVPDLGEDLRVTIDARLQLLLYEKLADQRGAAVVLDPRDGSILAMVSTPSFDPNQLDAGLFDSKGKDSPLLNRALRGLYPPASTWKVALAAYALDNGRTPSFVCPAEGYRADESTSLIRDHEYYSAQLAGRNWAGHGTLGLDEALIHSSNTYFAQLGVALGADATESVVDTYLLRSSIHVTHPRRPSLATESMRSWNLEADALGSIAQSAIGQGPLLATPLHMVTLIAAVANDGVAMRPRLLADAPSAELRRMMSESTARRLREILRRVVTEGTGRGLLAPPLRAAGKTGSAENPHGKAHSWFIGFEPHDAPEIALAIVVENAGFGSQVAAPMAKEVLLYLKSVNKPGAP